MKTALLFGTFDCLHNGHRNLFDQIKEKGYQIIICLALDEVVQRLKGKAPKQTFDQRKQALESIDSIIKVVHGDKNEGTFSAIELESPDVIALGYDQHELAHAVQNWMKNKDNKIPLITFDSFQADKYKSSLLREK